MKRIVSTARSECGLHPGTIPCRHCEFARVITEAALSRVVPQPRRLGDAAANVRRLTPDEVQRVREMSASGMSQWRIRKLTRLGSSSVARIVRGETYRDAPGDSTPPNAPRARTQSPRQRAAHQRVMPESAAEKTHRRTMVLHGKGRTAE